MTNKSETEVLQPTPWYRTQIGETFLSIVFVGVTGVCWLVSQQLSGWPAETVAGVDEGGRGSVREMSSEPAIPNHLHGECDTCGADLDEHGSNVTITSNSSGDNVTVRCDDCQEREDEHWRKLLDDA